MRVEQYLFYPIKTSRFWMKEAVNPNATVFASSRATLAARSWLLVQLVVSAVAFPFLVLNVLIQGWVCNNPERSWELFGQNTVHIFASILHSFMPLPSPRAARAVTQAELQNHISSLVNALEKNIAQVTSISNHERDVWIPTAKSAIAVLKTYSLRQCTPDDQVPQEGHSPQLVKQLRKHSCDWKAKECLLRLQAMSGLLCYTDGVAGSEITRWVTEVLRQLEVLKKVMESEGPAAVAAPPPPRAADSKSAVSIGDLSSK